MTAALIITHERKEGPGIFGDMLKARGFALINLYAPEGKFTKEMERHDLVLVMGGPMGVYETDKYAFIERELEFLKRRIETGLPTLGVCLGAQMIAGALGADVYPGGAGQEIGWNELRVLNDNHPLKHLEAPKTNMFHWHGDTFDLPKGADLLASTDLYKNQAFSYGQNTLALQFHPEMTTEMIKDWATVLGPDMGGSKITGSHEELYGQTEKNIATLNRQSKLFFNEWLDNSGFKA